MRLQSLSIFYDISTSSVNGRLYDEMGESTTFTLASNFYELTEGYGFNFDISLLFQSYDRVGEIHLVRNCVSFQNLDTAYNNPCKAIGDYYYFDADSLLDILEIRPPAVSALPSLNGNGCEFKDLTEVKVIGRTIVYQVSRSYMGLVSDNSYTALYDCVSISGETLTVPEALLTRYIAPVTTA